MPTLLHITVSPRGNQSISRRLSDAAVEAWIDHVVRAGKTFRYTAAGTPEGLPAGKKVLVIVASGGSYGERSGMSALDQEVPYLRFIFGFMGIADVRVMLGARRR